MFKSGIFFKDYRRQLLATISGRCEGIVKLGTHYKKIYANCEIHKESAIQFSWVTSTILADALMPLQIEDKINLTSRRLS